VVFCTTYRRLVTSVLSVSVRNVVLKLRWISLLTRELWVRVCLWVSSELFLVVLSLLKVALASAW